MKKYLIYIIVLIFTISVIGCSNNKKSKDKEISKEVNNIINHDNKISFEIPDDWVNVNLDYDIENALYYVYKNDMSGNSGVIYVAYKIFDVGDLDNFRNNFINSYINEKILSDESMTNFDITEYVNSYGFNVIKVITEQKVKETHNVKNYDYYVIGKNGYGQVWGMSIDDNNDDNVQNAMYYITNKMNLLFK